MNPLEDPSYVPLHPPVDGRVPAVVARWGPRSQVRWFRRFFRSLRPATFDGLFTSSVAHYGGCCHSCFEDGWDAVACCCKGYALEVGR